MYKLHHPRPKENFKQKEVWADTISRLDARPKARTKKIAEPTPYRCECLVISSPSFEYLVVFKPGRK
jgi:hypothetical protein